MQSKRSIHCKITLTPIMWPFKNNKKKKLKEGKKSGDIQVAFYLGFSLPHSKIKGSIPKTM